MGTAVTVALLILAGACLADFAAIVVIGTVLTSAREPGRPPPRFLGAQVLLAAMLLAKNLLNDPLKVWMRTPGEFHADAIASAFVWSRPPNQAIPDALMLLADALVLSWGIGATVVLLFATMHDQAPALPARPRLAYLGKPSIFAVVTTILVHDIVSDDSFAMSAVLVVLGIVTFTIVCRSEHRKWTKPIRGTEHRADKSSTTLVRRMGKVALATAVTYAYIEAGPLIIRLEVNAQWADKAGAVIPMVLMMMLATTIDIGRSQASDWAQDRTR